MHRYTLMLPAALTALLSGCASFHPQPLEIETLRATAMVESQGDITVRARLLSKEETRRHFDAKLWKEHIQPIWIEVENTTDHPLWLPRVAVDNDYYPTAEVSYRNRRFAAPHTNQKITQYFRANELPLIHPPGQPKSGFVFAEYVRDSKAFNVELLGGGSLNIFHFRQETPGFNADLNRVQFNQLYPQEAWREVDVTQLREELEKLPGQTTDARGKKSGDPLNLVIIGNQKSLTQALIRSGWHLSEPEGSGAYWRTFRAFLLGNSYLTAPVSHLYALNRFQDIALQKPRHSIKQRNHMRLWLTPLRFHGASVWLGQISRDTGVRFTPHTWHLSTHKIAPDVDEARAYLVSDLFNTQALQTIGWVQGLESASPSSPHYNLTGDPFYTDGLRTVILLSDEVVDVRQIQRFDWELPPQPPLDWNALQQFTSP